MEADGRHSSRRTPSPDGVVAIKIFPAVKIAGATHCPSVPVLPTSNEFLPDPCSSMSSNVMNSLDDITPSPVSPVLNGGEATADLPDELEFDEFLLDAAEWL